MQTLNLPKSRFTENLVRLNGLRFRKWIFEPGMLFLSESKWWGDKGARGLCHNGLDLRLFETDIGSLKTIGAGTIIPIIYEGRIVKSIRDFLGYTLIAAHEIYERNSQLFTLYGHVRKVEDVFIGKRFSEGAVIANLNETDNMKVPSHLHMSVALIPKEMPLEDLIWKNLDENKEIVFFDPKDIIQTSAYLYFGRMK